MNLFCSRARSMQPLNITLTVFINFIFPGCRPTDIRGYWCGRANTKESDVSSLTSLLVVVESMSSVECFQHWLATGRASGHKNSATIIPHRIMYFLPYPSSPLPSPSSLSHVWEGHGGMVLKRIWTVLNCPERIYRSRRNRDGEWRTEGGNWLTQVDLEGWRRVKVATGWPRLTWKDGGESRWQLADPGWPGRMADELVCYCK